MYGHCCGAQRACCRLRGSASAGLSLERVWLCTSSGGGRFILGYVLLPIPQAPFTPPGAIHTSPQSPAGVRCRLALRLPSSASSGVYS